MPPSEAISRSLHRPASYASSRFVIGVVTQYYPMRWQSLSRTIAERLSGRGHQVKVLTTAHGNGGGHSTASGLGDLRVRYVPSYRDRSDSGLKRFVTYASFSLSSLLGWPHIAGTDVNYVYATQPTAAIAADLVKYVKGVPFVLHVQDVWPDSVTHSGMTGGPLMTLLIDRVLRPWVSYIYRRADAVIAISPEMRDLLIDRGLDREKVYSVYNWTKEVRRSRGAKRTVDAAGDQKTLFVYGGNMGPMQDLGSLILAMKELEDSDSEAELLMVGDGSLSSGLQTMVEEEGLSSIKFRGRVSREEMVKIHEQADFLLVTLKDIPIFRANVPSKFQAALAAGKPVVTTALGAVGDIVQEQGVGFVAPPENPKALAVALRRASSCTREQRDQMGARAVEFYEANMRERGAIDRIEGILLNVAEKPPTRVKK